MKLQDDVRTFMTIGGQEVAPAPSFPETSFEALVLLEQTQAHLHVLSADLKSIPGALPLRSRILVEEVAETVAAMARHDMVGTADGLIDILYVTVGAANTLGIDLGPLWDAIHGANLAKFETCPECSGEGSDEATAYADVDPGDGKRIPCRVCRGEGKVAIRDTQGKILKPTGWKPVDLVPLLVAQGWTPEDPADPVDHGDVGRTLSSREELVAKVVRYEEVLEKNGIALSEAGLLGRFEEQPGLIAHLMRERNASFNHGEHVEDAPE